MPERSVLPDVGLEHAAKSASTCAGRGSRDPELRQERAMKVYEFTLHFRLPADRPAPDRWLDALFEAGCDDAVVGVGRKGNIALQFAREASRPAVALSRALRDVRKAIPGAVFLSAEPDLLNLAEVARVFGMTRQNVRKYAAYETRRIAAPFPSPVVLGAESKWRLAEIADWARAQSVGSFPAEIGEIAHETARLNIKTQLARLG
jgi:predicted DNA-binding transcriptional regulator AlpA